MYDPRVFGAHPGHLTKLRSTSESQRAKAVEKERQREEEAVNEERQPQEVVNEERLRQEAVNEERQREETVIEVNGMRDHVPASNGRVISGGSITPNYRSDNPPDIAFAWEEVPGKDRPRDGEEVYQRPRWPRKAHRVKLTRRSVFLLCGRVSDVEGSEKVVSTSRCEPKDGSMLPEPCMFHDRVTCDRDKAGKPRLWCSNALAASDDDLEEEPLRPSPRCLSTARRGNEDQFQRVGGSAGSLRQGSVFPVSPTTFDRTLMCRGKERPAKPVNRTVSAKTGDHPLRGISRFLHGRPSPGQSSSPRQLGEKKRGLTRRKFPDSVCIPNLGSVEQDVHDPARMAGKVSNLLQSQSVWEYPKTALVRVATCDVLGCMPP